MFDPAQLQPLLLRLGEALEKEPVRFALLLGSAAEGLPFRDLDVAVEPLPSFQPGPMERLDLGLRLERAVGAPVDLVWLPEAPPGLRYEATRGRVLLCRDEEALADFREGTWRVWFDLKPRFEQQAHDLLSAPPLARPPRAAS